MDDKIDGRREAVPLRGFFFKLDAACGGERVELGDAACFGLGALAFDPTSLFETVKGGVEGALLDLQDLARDLLDTFGDGPTMFGLERKGLQVEQVESALHEIVGFAHSMIIYTGGCR